jgi:putative ABC transport system permease protein
MRFALAMAWRESRAGWRHVVTMLACVALGVAALVAVGSLSVELARTVNREAKTLLGGDVEVRAARVLPPAISEAARGLERRGAALVESREMVGMARAANGASLLVEVKAVHGDYPLYGRLATDPAAPLATLLRDHGALVESSLLARLGVRTGERFALGDVTLVVRGVVTAEPDRPATLVNLGPRVLISAETLSQSGLVAPGSRVRHRLLFRLPPGVLPAEAREALAAAVDDPSIRVSAYDEGQAGLRRFLDQLGTYLGLVGLVSLLVGGVGVAASVATFMRRRRPTIAALKCLGADQRTLLATYVIQAQTIGLAGSAIGAGLGMALLPVLIWITQGLVPFPLEGRADAVTIVRGIAMGGAMTLLCALWPLLRIRDVRPAEVLRQEVAPPPRTRSPWLAALPIACGLAALAIWQAGAWKVGGIFVGASLAALVLLAALGRLVVAVARRLPRKGALAWRQGVSGLSRPGGQVTGVVVALGVGVMLLVAVALLEASLGAQLDHERRRETPSFFFVDIQNDQRDAFEALVRERTGITPTLTAVVRARLAAVGPEPITRAYVDERRASRGGEQPFFLIREYVLTSAAALPPGNTVTAGRWWTEGSAPGRPEVSLEDEMAKSLRVGIGDTVAFDVQGVRLDAAVTSVRHVEWQTLTTNFFAILSPGTLDGAPTTWVGTARVPAAAEVALQDAVVARFPNVTAVPVRDVLERVNGLLGQMASAIRAIAAFSIAAGVVVMVAALTATRAQRLYESVVLRTLGATRGVVARAFAVEYACLGATAGVGGTVLAAVLSWLVLHFLLEAPWQLTPVTLVAGVVLATVLSVAVGFLTTWRLLGQKPLPVLRRE